MSNQLIKVAEFISSECKPYDPHVPKRDVGGGVHPDRLVEACGLACITPPEITYQIKSPKILKDIANEGTMLSTAQVEALLYACQCHESFFRAAYENIELDSKVRKKAAQRMEVEEGEDDFGMNEEEGVAEEDEHVQDEDDIEFEEEEQVNDEEDRMDVDDDETLDESMACVHVPDNLPPDTEQEKNYRRGFFLGDGTGTGKTRILAAIVSENFFMGVRRCLWVTANKDLFKDAKDPLTGLFLGHDNHQKSKVYFVPNNFRSYKKQETKIEVYLITYRKLVHTEKLLEIEDWLREDPNCLMIFDESHSAKAAYRKGKQSLTGLRVMRLQFNFPRARVVYSTATAASEADHLFLLNRLQLWGPGTAYQSKDEFRKIISQGGVAALEQMSMEMKLAGKYLSRQLSYDKVVVEVMDALLSEEFTVVYERSTQLWSLLFEVQAILKEKFIRKYGGGDNQKAMEQLSVLLSSLHQSCQSFFGSIMVSAKVNKLDSVARYALRGKRSVVVGIQRTGDALFKKFEQEIWSKNQPYSNAACILRTAMCNLGISLGYPRTYLKDGRELKIGNQEIPWTPEKIADADKFGKQIWYSDKKTKYGIRVTDADLDASGIQIPSTIRNVKKWYRYCLGRYYTQPELDDPGNISWSYDDVREKVTLAGLAKLYHELTLMLPINPLDEIITRFENPDQIEGKTEKEQYPVAEITGRSFQYLYNAAENIWYKTPEKQADSSGNQETSSQRVKTFMDKTKRIAILSNKGSTGISLHSDKKKSNKERRIHITLECGWSADQLLQQLGRSHRSNQKNAPRYVILNSQIPGEMRFIAAVGKRLRSLGAVSQGTPNANPHTGHLSDDLFSILGIRAINATIRDENHDERTKRLLQTIKLIPDNEQRVRFTGDKSSTGKVNQFLNRLMVLPIDVQRQLLDKIDETIRQYQREAFVYKGLRVVGAGKEDVRLIEQCKLSVDGQKATMYRFNISRFATWEYIMEVRSKIPSLEFRLKKENDSYQVAAVYENRSWWAIYPYNRNEVEVPVDEEKELEKLSDYEAEKIWKRDVELIQLNPLVCHHEAWGKECDFCSEETRCTYKWGIMDCLLIAGYTTKLVKEESKLLKPVVQFAKVSYKLSEENATSTTTTTTVESVAGMFVCYENCDSDVSAMFEYYKRRYGNAECCE